MTDTSSADTERALLAAAQRGDRDALLALLERHQAQIYRFGLKLCRNPDDAQDVLQDTMLTVARTLPSFRGQSSLSTWLYTIARSFCIKRRRRSKAAHGPEASLDAPETHAERLADAAPTPEGAASDRELERALHAAIDALPAMYREVLLLRDMEGLPAQEVAQVLGLTVEAVKSRLHRARKSVREQLLAVAPPTAAAAAAGCPDIVSMWSAHLEDDISTADCARMEQHIAGCARCQSDCDALKRTLRMCRTVADGTQVPPTVQRAVRIAVQDFLTRS